MWTRRIRTGRSSWGSGNHSIEGNRLLYRGSFFCCEISGSTSWDAAGWRSQLKSGRTSASRLPWKQETSGSTGKMASLGLFFAQSTNQIGAGAGIWLLLPFRERRHSWGAFGKRPDRGVHRLSCGSRAKDNLCTRSGATRTLLSASPASAPRSLEVFVVTPAAHSFTAARHSLK